LGVLLLSAEAKKPLFRRCACLLLGHVVCLLQSVSMSEPTPPAHLAQTNPTRTEQLRHPIRERWDAQWPSVGLDQPAVPSRRPWAFCTALQQSTEQRASLDKQGENYMGSMTKVRGNIHILLMSVSRVCSGKAEMRTNLADGETSLQSTSSNHSPAACRPDRETLWGGGGRGPARARHWCCLNNSTQIREVELAFETEFPAQWP
jgi:hypothetical protein